MDVLLDPLPGRPVLNHRPQGHRPLAASVDLLRVSHPTTDDPSPLALDPVTRSGEADDHRLLSSASQVMKTMSGSKGEVNRGGGGVVDGEGLYCPYHPFCRACQGTTLDSGGQEGQGDSLYFNYMRFAAARPSRVRPPLLCSSYPLDGALDRSKTGPVPRPFTRDGTRFGPGAGDRLIAPASAGRRRHHFRMPSRILFRFSSKQTTSGSAENKAETSVDGGGGGGGGGGSGKTGKAIVAKNRCAGEGGSALCRRYKNQRMVVMVIFLLSLFVAVAAAVLGAVLVLSPMNSRGKCRPFTHLT